jgi:hypothetical protein
MGWMIGVQGFGSQWGLEIFLFSMVSIPALESTHPLIQWVLEALSPGIKQS